MPNSERPHVEAHPPYHHYMLANDTRTDDERAFAWAEYRKDYEPNPEHFAREAMAFQAGWDAHTLHRTVQGEPSDAGGNPLTSSDLMGRFAFDGAEGYAFHIYDADDHEKLQASIEFAGLETLKAFLQHNFPGLFA